MKRREFIKMAPVLFVIPALAKCVDTNDDTMYFLLTDDDGNETVFTGKGTVLESSTMYEFSDGGITGTAEVYH